VRILRARWRGGEQRKGRHSGYHGHERAFAVDGPVEFQHHAWALLQPVNYYRSPVPTAVFSVLFLRHVNPLRAVLIGLAPLVCAFALAYPASAQETATPQQAADESRWGFYFSLGAGGLSGDFGDSLHKAATGEWGISEDRGKWRRGFGLSFGSFGMKAPYDHELEFGFQRIFVSLQRNFNQGSTFQPYLQGRFGVARLHPRSELFAMDPLPDDFEIGDSPTPSSNGISIGVVPGIEWNLNQNIALDMSVLLDYFYVGDTDLSPVGGGSASSGFDWQARIGVRWYNGTAPGATPAEPDAWGIRPSFGWALGEALSINFGASAFNEYVRNANFNQISPRSWERNLEEGFTYDDNEFKTNQFIHPFNGSQYYNAARSNGLSFWPSYGIAMVGAFQWEWMGETHPK
jgi:hypothetical protein